MIKPGAMNPREDLVVDRAQIDAVHLGAERGRRRLHAHRPAASGIVRRFDHVRTPDSARAAVSTRAVGSIRSAQSAPTSSRAGEIGNARSYLAARSVRAP